MPVKAQESFGDDITMKDTSIGNMSFKPECQHEWNYDCFNTYQMCFKCGTKEERNYMSTSEAKNIKEMLNQLADILDLLSKKIDIIENSLRPIPDGKASFMFYNPQTKENTPITIGQTLSAIISSMNPVDCPECIDEEHKKSSVAH